MIRFFRKIIFIIFILLTFNGFGQQDTTKVKKRSLFDQEFNTWTVGAGVSNLIMHGDFRSFGTAARAGFINFGTYVNASRMFNPIIGLEVRLNYSGLGSSGQYLSDDYEILYVGAFRGEALHMEGKSYGFEGSLIIDLDNLWRRQSEKWNFGVLLGVGYQRYTSKVIVSKTGYIIPEADFSKNPERRTNDHASSLYLNTALSLRYRLNRKIDLELRTSLNINNEDHLDAAISPKQNYESFFVTSLGVVYKFGSKDKHAIWFNEKDEKSKENDPFELLDSDDDGVPDLFDKEPETPKEADVYGSGEAIDTDKDGLQDYLDKCPLVPGPIENEGCPYPEEVKEPEPVEVVEPVIEESEKQKIMKQISLLSKAIYFKTASDVLKQESYKPLNEISDIMFQYPQSKYNIEGHTDSRGKASYNKDLSNRRARSVYNYLTKSGIASNRLSSEGFGEDRPIRTNETEEGRQFNRRVEINFIDPKSKVGKLVYDEDVSFTEEYEVDSEVINEISSELLELDTSKLSNVVIDSDGDGVTDLYDEEPETPEGAKVYGNGVSIDTDADGIPDYKDKCPLEFGSEENNGCSNEPKEQGAKVTAEDIETAISGKFEDADNDGVADIYDQEADTPEGVKVYGNGVAVDSDDDGIADYLDECPFEKGTEAKNGCSDELKEDEIKLTYPIENTDSDKDGVADVYDKEPNTPDGVKVYGNGVAVDSDDDGVADYLDDCPFKKGSADKNGCPDIIEEAGTKLTAEDVEAAVSNKFADADKDGVADVYDQEADTPEGVKVYGNGVAVDSDDDGIPDYLDECPFEKGTKAKNGCSDELKKEDIKLTYAIENADTDKDGVADIYDKEPNTPEGVKVYGNGVAVDSDDDGVADYLDNCPFVKGSDVNNGCPDSIEEKVAKVSKEDVESAVSGKFVDTDGDGVIDLYDKEPNTPKESRVYGDGVSIDSDFDGIPDYKDGCPFAKGLANNDGCPIETKEPIAVVSKPVVAGKKDSDGDGVVDVFDKEPNTPPNVKVYANGVSIDSDKDGVPDYKDRCPLIKGEKTNNGCPLIEDLDGDGVPDNLDLCPSLAGLASNKGCPEKKITSNVNDQFEVLASQIKFSRSEGHILKSNNLAILSQIADIMNEYKATTFTIEVHTSTKPNLKYNLELSKRRAYAIKKYLTSKGVFERRLTVNGLGATKLKYPSSSATEDAKNNRVEIKVN